MSVEIRLPPALIRIAGDDRLIVAGGTVSAALDDMDRQHPGLSDRIRTEADAPRQHVLIYVNDTEVRELDGLKTPLRDGDKLFVVAAVSGG